MVLSSYDNRRHAFLKSRTGTLLVSPERCLQRKILFIDHLSRPVAHACIQHVEREKYVRRYGGYHFSNGHEMGTVSGVLEPETGKQLLTDF